MTTDDTTVLQSTPVIPLGGTFLFERRALLAEVNRRNFAEAHGALV